MAAEASIAELRDRLAEFEAAYEMCSYIDHWPDVLRCRRINREAIERLKHEIRRREEDGDERQARPAVLWAPGNGEDYD